MEFHGLENIIETLLVGAVVSVCLMSLVFIFFGQVLQVKVIRLLLEFLVYEKGTADELEKSRAEEQAAQAAKEQDTEANGEEPDARAKLGRHVGHPAGGTLGRQPRAHRRAEHADTTESGLSKDAASKTQETFLIVLVISSLYGLGIITESMSDRLLGVEDAAVKVESFRGVSQGQLASGTARPDFSRFFTDYRACTNRFRDLEPTQGSGFLDTILFWTKKGDKPSPDHFDTHELCTGVLNHAQGFYYNAKNQVFREETFQHELTVLQSRINFVRSATLAFLIFTYELALACAIAFAAEGLYRIEKKHGFFQHTFGRLPRRLQRPLDWVFGGWVPPLASHWKNFDAIRCSLFLCGAVCFSWCAHTGWRESERQFDKRVFGYFLTMGEKEVAELTPQSTYRLFAIHDLRSFEPSGVQPLGTTSSVMVVNDKGRGIDRFVVFDRGAATSGSGAAEDEGTAPRDVRAASASASASASPPAVATENGANTEADSNVLSARSSAGRWDVLRRPRRLLADVDTTKALSQLRKVEAFATRDLRQPAPSKVEVFAIATFATPADRQLLRFDVDTETMHASCPVWVLKPDAVLHGRAEREPNAPATLDLAKESPNPCELFKGQSAGKEAEHVPTCTVEGIVAVSGHDTESQPAATTVGAEAADGAQQEEHEQCRDASASANDNLHFILGVRSIDDEPVVALVALDREEGSWKQRLLFRSAAKKDDALFCQGVSDLEIHDQDLYVLTSYEMPETGDCRKVALAAADKRGAVAEADQVHGALFRVPFGKTNDENRAQFNDPSRWELVERFIHKPEGVGRTIEGSLLIVFDDDARRKSLDDAPATFPLEQNESVFAVIGPRARRELLPDKVKNEKR